MSYEPIGTKSVSSLIIDFFLAPMQEFKANLKIALPSLSENKEFSWTDRIIQSGKELIFAMPFVRYFCDQSSAKDAIDLKNMLKEVDSLHNLIALAGYSSYFPNDAIKPEQVHAIVNPKDTFNRDLSLKKLLVFADRLSQIDNGQYKESAFQIINQAKGLYYSFDERNTDESFEKLKNKFIDSNFAAQVDGT